MSAEDDDIQLPATLDVHVDIQREFLLHLDETGLLWDAQLPTTAGQVVWLPLHDIVVDRLKAGGFQLDCIIDDPPALNQACYRLLAPKDRWLRGNWSRIVGEHIAQSSFTTASLLDVTQLKRKFINQLGEDDLQGRGKLRVLWLSKCKT